VRSSRCRSPLETRARKRARIVIARGSRIYLVCGAAAPSRKRRRLVWLPGAALFFVLAISVLAIVHPVEPPESVQRRLPLAQVAHYTAEDFFTAAR
jgi:hypothetical protein